MANSTIIRAGTRIDGHIRGDADVAIEGVVEGHINLTESLTVGESGLVHAEIHAREAIIEGAVRGAIQAQDRIVLAASARVVGSLDAPSIRIEDGARFSGEVSMNLAPADEPATSTVARSTAKTPASAPARAPSPPRQARPATSTSHATSTSTAAATRPAAAATTTTTVVEETQAQAADADPEPDAAPDFAEMPDQEVQDFTVKELREELRERDLPVSGTKDELIERLRDADRD